MIFHGLRQTPHGHDCFKLAGTVFLLAKHSRSVHNSDIRGGKSIFYQGLTNHFMCQPLTMPRRNSVSVCFPCSPINVCRTTWFAWVVLNELRLCCHCATRSSRLYQIDECQRRVSGRETEFYGHLVCSRLPRRVRAAHFLISESVPEHGKCPLPTAIPISTCSRNMKYAPTRKIADRQRRANEINMLALLYSRPPFIWGTTGATWRPSLIDLTGQSGHQSRHLWIS